MFTSWITAIVAVVVLGLALDILMPEGEMEKYVKGVFSLVVIFVIISPLPALSARLKSGSVLNTSAETSLDESFLSSVLEQSTVEKEKAIEAALLEQGAVCSVDIVNTNGRAAFVTVNISETVISGENRNSISVDGVRELVSRLTGVALELIVVYE